MKRPLLHFEMNISYGKLREYRKLTDCVLMRLIRVGSPRNAVRNVKYLSTATYTYTRLTYAHILKTIRAQFNEMAGCLIALSA